MYSESGSRRKKNRTWIRNTGCRRVATLSDLYILFCISNKLEKLLPNFWTHYNREGFFLSQSVPKMLSKPHYSFLFQLGLLHVLRLFSFYLVQYIKSLVFAAVGTRFDLSAWYNQLKQLLVCCVTGGWQVPTCKVSLFNMLIHNRGGCHHWSRRFGIFVIILVAGVKQKIPLLLLVIPPNERMHNFN